MSLSVSIHAQVPKSGLLFFPLEKSIFKVSVITGYQQQKLSVQLFSSLLNGIQINKLGILKYCNSTANLHLCLEYVHRK